MDSEPKSTSEGPTPGEIRAALEHMLVSDIFRSSPQLAAFLRFVTEATLRGKAGRIKAYTIGVEVLRRDQSFDPQADPIVRVEATRLRRALTRYYAGPGVGDPILIDLPPGSYVPRFRPAAALRPEPRIEAAKPAASPLWRRHLIPLAMAVAAVLLVAIGAGILVRGIGGSSNAAISGTPRPGNGMPMLLVQKFANGQGAEIGWEASLHEKLRNALSRFDSINIVVDPLPAGREIKVDYQLTGKIDYRGVLATNVRFELLDTAEAKVVWSGAFALTGSDQATDENRIVAELAAKLLQPFGVVRSHERARHLAGPAGDPRYRCLLEGSESLRSFDLAVHARARACLEQLTVQHKDFDSGFTYLAAIYFREYQYGFGARAGDTPALDRAMRAARRGIELAPESARAYQILATVLFGNRDIAAAFAASDRAIALNPFDMTILSDYAGRLVLTGQVERGMEILRQAAQAGAIRPSWYHFYVFLGSYLKDDQAVAAAEANQLTIDNYVLGYVARALTAQAAGDRDRARQQLQKLVELAPAWRTDLRGQLAKFFPDSAIAERLAVDLMAAGFTETTGRVGN